MSKLIILISLYLLIVERGSTFLFGGDLKLTTLIDGPNLSTKSIAYNVCTISKGIEKQISRFATIDRLINYFELLEDRDAVNENERIIKDCATRHLNGLRSLYNVITRFKDNVCSDEKITLIENFHKQYVATTTSNELTNGNNNNNNNKQLDQDRHRYHRVPYLLSLFFMNYAMEVSRICKLDLISNLATDLTSKDFTIDELASDESMRLLLERVVQNIGNMYSMADFEEVFLLWDKMHDPSMKMLAKLKDASKMHQLQQVCLTKFKPIYSKLIWPVVRLAKIGYINRHSRIERELHELDENDISQQWYSIVQLCETILPIEFYTDRKMSPTEIGLISREEAASLEHNDADLLFDDEDVVVYEARKSSMEEVDRLWSVVDSETQDLIKQIDLNRDASEEASNRLLRRTKSKLKQLTRSNSIGVFKSVMAPNGKTIKEDLSKMVKKAPEEMSDSDVHILEGSITEDSAATNGNSLLSSKTDDDDELGQQEKNTEKKESKLKNALMSPFRSIRKMASNAKNSVGSKIANWRVNNRFFRFILKVLLAFFGSIAMIFVIISAFIASKLIG